MNLYEFYMCNQIILTFDFLSGVFCGKILNFFQFSTSFFSAYNKYKLGVFYILFIQILRGK